MAAVSQWRWRSRVDLVQAVGQVRDAAAESRSVHFVLDGPDLHFSYATKAGHVAQAVILEVR